MNSESNKNDEIDLLLILSKIKFLFASIWSFLSSIYYIALKRWSLLLLCSVPGISIGIALFFYMKPVYISTLTVSSNALSNDFCSDIIEDLELIIKDKTPDLLAEKLKIDANIANQIKEIEFQNYDEKLKKLYKDQIQTHQKQTRYQST